MTFGRSAVGVGRGAGDIVGVGTSATDGTEVSVGTGVSCVGVADGSSSDVQATNIRIAIKKPARGHRFRALARNISAGPITPEDDEIGDADLTIARKVYGRLISVLSRCNAPRAS